MPKILERLVGQLQAKGMPSPKAHAIATSALQRSGNLKPGSQEATPQGVARGKMSPAARAKDRASKATSGAHAKGEYKYDAKTNRATLKGSKKK